MNCKRISKFLGACGLLGLLTACNTVESNRTASEIDQHLIKASEAYHNSNMLQRDDVKDTVASSQGVWLGNQSNTRPNRNTLPDQFETDTGFTLMMGEKTTLPELANQVTTITGIPVQIDDKVTASKVSQQFNVRYSGKLSQFLSHTGTELGLLWYYDKGRIVFFETETKTFSLHSLATNFTVNSKVKGQDDANSLTVDAQMKEWDEIDKGVQAILDGVTNAKYTTARSSGVITVTAAPSVLGRISDFVKSYNDRLARQVTVDVQVVQVDLNDENSTGFSLSGIISGVGGTALTATSLSNLDPTIPVSAFSIGQASTNNKAILNALATQGRIAIMTSTNITTRNDRPAPVSNTESISYIASFETKDFESNSTSTVQPTVLTVGFYMMMLPHILSNGTVNMSFRMDLSELIQMQNTVVGQIAVQLPHVESRSFQNEVTIKSGETLIVSGFEKIRQSDTKYGIGTPDFMALGGSHDTTATRSVLVVLITPHVLMSPLDPEKRVDAIVGAPIQ